MSPEAALGLGKKALGAAVVGALLLGFAFTQSKEYFFQAYLRGFYFWFSIGLGALAIQAIHTLTGGKWGILVWKPMYSASSTLPLMAVLFLPVLAGMDALYLWAGSHEGLEGHVAHILHEKHAYLNVPFFAGRFAFYFLTWIVLQRIVYKNGTAVGATAKPTATMRRWGGPVLVLYAVTGTFMSIDWLMSQDALWFSSMFPAQIMEGAILSAMAFALFFISKTQAAEDVAKDRLHDAGKLLFGFIMLWGYLSFSQYLIIYGGNTAEDIPWFVHRTEGPWKPFAQALIALHFVVPWLVLVSARTKKNLKVVGAITGLLLVMRYVELYWITAPNYSKEHLQMSAGNLAGDFGALLAVGGLWLFVFCRTYARKETQLVAGAA